MRGRSNCPVSWLDDLERHAARQLDVELVGELVTQAMRRYPELTLGNSDLLHHAVEALERLFERQAWMSQM